MGGRRQDEEQLAGFAACDLKHVPPRFSGPTVAMNASLVGMAKGVAMMTAPLPKEAWRRFNDAEKKKASALDEKRHRLVRDVQRFAGRTSTRFDDLRDELEDADWKKYTTLPELLRNMSGPQGGENLEKLREECAELGNHVQTLQQEYKVFTQEFERRGESFWDKVKNFFTHICSAAELIWAGVKLYAEVAWERFCTFAETGAWDDQAAATKEKMIRVEKKFAEAWKELKESVAQTDPKKAEILKRLDQIAEGLGEMSTQLTSIEGDLEISLQDSLTRKSMGKLCGRIVTACEVLKKLCIEQLTLRVGKESTDGETGSSGCALA